MACSLCLGIVGRHWRGSSTVRECGFSLLAVNVAAAILETEYVPSKLNVVCDGLSRGIPPSELGHDEGLWIRLPDTGPVVQYIRSCDPRLPLTTWPQVIDHMGQCHQLLSRI